MNRFLRLWRPTSAKAAGDELDSLDAFLSEYERRRRVSAAAELLRARRRRFAAAGSLVAVIAVTLVLVFTGYARTPLSWIRPAPKPASVTFESDPPGASIISNGVTHGVTPLSLALPAGVHYFEIAKGTFKKDVRIDAAAGATIVHHVEIGAPLAATADRASLEVLTDPERLPVSVNGVTRGTSPLRLDDLDPGPHTVQVTGTGGLIERKVSLEAGKTSSVVITAPRASAGPAAGWLALHSPLALQIVEKGEIVGTSESPRIMLPAGRHQLQLVNESAGYSESRVVQISAGQTASVQITPPRAPLSVNAVPWAEIWIDGRRVGETPIGNYLVTIGSHEVVFRHPELGERKQTVIVSLKKPTRVSVNMRQES